MSEQYHIRKYSDNENSIALDRATFNEFVRVLTLIGVLTSYSTEVTPYEEHGDVDIDHTLVVY